MILIIQKNFPKFVKMIAQELWTFHTQDFFLHKKTFQAIGSHFGDFAIFKT